MSMEGHLNDVLGKPSPLYSKNASATTKKALQEFNNASKEIYRGERSILSYKKNQPLELHNKAIRLSLENGTYYAKISLLDTAGKSRFNYPYYSVRFKLDVKERSERAILDRCLDGSYKVTASRLIYNDRKNDGNHFWSLNLGYEFTPETADGLDPDRILGVDLGITYPLCASVYGSWDRMVIKGGEIEAFRAQTEHRRWSLQDQGKYCGEGRIGHGRATRCKPSEAAADKVARFRNTCNHKYSKALIDYAIRQHCGTIQMEDLTGITDHSNRFLKSWPYYDLQSKTIYKAEEAGIRVVKVPARYTSQRCSHCGHIDPNNRPEQSRFVCVKCGYGVNADYNASQNLSIKEIDKVIQKDMARIQMKQELP